MVYVLNGIHMKCVGFRRTAMSCIAFSIPILKGRTLF